MITKITRNGINGAMFVTLLHSFLVKISKATISNVLLAKWTVQDPKLLPIYSPEGNLHKESEDLFFSKTKLIRVRKITT